MITEEIFQVKLSPNYTQELGVELYTVKSNLSIISLNVRCISATFDDFQIEMTEASKIYIENQ